MTVVQERRSGGPREEQPERTFDRQPPQDMAAEQSVLGGMLLSKDALAEVSEDLLPEDFYKPPRTRSFSRRC